MGNPRNWTTTFNARTRELQAFVNRRAGKSQVKRKLARERAAIRPVADHEGARP